MDRMLCQQRIKKWDRKMKGIRITAGITLFLFGIGCFFYPNFREWNTQREVGQIIREFEGNHNVLNMNIQEEEQTEAKPMAYPELYEEMKQYNEQLVTEGQKIADAWCYEQTPVDLSVLNNEDFAIGYIEIPEMEVRLPLYIGASSDNLAKGAAVLAGTSMPIGGKNTNCVIAAHRGWRGSAYFQMIENLKEGSVVYVTNPWETLTYIVTGTKIVDPTEVSAIMLQEGKDMVTLISCHPYASSGRTYRYLVFCDRLQKETSAREENEKEAERNKKEKKLEQDSGLHIQEKGEENLLQMERKLRVYLPVMTAMVAAVVIFIRAIMGRKHRKK